MKRSYLALSILTVVALVSAVGVGIAVGKRDKASDSEVQGKAIEANKVGFKADRDPSLVERPLSDQDQKSGQLWELRQPAGSPQLFVISSYYEQGAELKKLASATKKPLKEAVLDNVERQLPQQYPHFKELDRKDLTINGTQSTEIIFEYESKGVTVKQRLMLLFKNSDTVVYIRGQAKAAEFDEVNSRYFEPLFQSAKFE